MPPCLMPLATLASLSPSHQIHSHRARHTRPATLDPFPVCPGHCVSLTGRLGGRNKANPSWFLVTEDWDSVLAVMIMNAMKALGQVMQPLTPAVLDALETWWSHTPDYPVLINPEAHGAFKAAMHLARRGQDPARRSPQLEDLPAEFRTDYPQVGVAESREKPKPKIAKAEPAAGEQAEPAAGEQADANERKPKIAKAEPAAGEQAEPAAGEQADENERQQKLAELDLLRCYDLTIPVTAEDICASLARRGTPQLAKVFEEFGQVLQSLGLGGIGPSQQLQLLHGQNFVLDIAVDQAFTIFGHMD